MKRTNNFTASILVLVLTAGVSFAQSTGGGSGNRIRGGGGQVQVNPDGSVDVTNPVNQSTILNRALGWRCLVVQPPVSPPGQARVYNDCATQLLRISTNGGAYVTLGGTGAAGTGTVTSIGISNLAPLFTVAPSAITTSGTFTFALNSQAASSFFAAPAGATGSPVFRGIVASDIPALDVSKITTGVFGNARGGTGLSSYTFGDTLFANGAGALSTLPGNTSSTRKFYSQTGNGTFSGVPAWNVLANTDLPSVNLATANVNGGIAGVLGTANGGTGLFTIGNANTLLGVNNLGNGYEFKTPIAGNNISISHTAGGIRFDVNSVIATSTLAPDGSAAAPSISFQNEQSSGHYRFGAGDVRVSILGSDVARFFSGGLGLGAGGLKFGTVIGSPDVTLTRASAGGLRIDGTAAGNGTLTLATLTGNVLGTASGNESPLTFSTFFTRTGNAISASYTPENIANKAIANGYASLNSSGVVPTAQLPAFQSPLGFTPENIANKAIANGYASLNSSGVVPTAQLPALNYLPLTGGTLTGTLGVPNGGSTSSLSIAFNGTYPNTGFYVPSGSADGVAFALNGSVHSALNSAGFVLNTGKYLGDGSSLTSVNAAQLNGQTATSANTASTIVARNANGNVSTNGLLIGRSAFSAWDTAVLKPIEGGVSDASTTIGAIAFGNVGDLNAASNAYYGSGGWRYKATAPASNWYLYNGTFNVRVAPSGTAGALLTWTDVLVANASGFVGFGGNLTPTRAVDAIGDVRASNQLISTVATGTAPIAVTSTTVNPNLNAALLNGQTATNANTPNTIVARDASGNFSAGTITAANLTGSSAGSHINQAAANSDTAGIIVFSATSSQTKNFATAFNSAPVCVVTPRDDTSLRYWVTTTTTSLTINLSSATTTNLSFNYICDGNPN